MSDVQFRVTAFIINVMERPLKQKIFTCPRCGKRFAGRQDRCPRCGQLIVYELDGKFYNALGDQLLLAADGKHIEKTIRNRKRPK